MYPHYVFIFLLSAKHPYSWTKKSDFFSDVFDSRDIKRLKNEDAYVERFFMHMYDLPGSQEDNAVNMAVSAFKWRKELKVNGESHVSI